MPGAEEEEKVEERIRARGRVADLIQGAMFDLTAQRLKQRGSERGRWEIRSRVEDEGRDGD